LRATVEKERPKINPSAAPTDLEHLSNEDALERIIKSKGRLVHSYTQTMNTKRKSLNQKAHCFHRTTFKSCEIALSKLTISS
jgi:hypothetical protein